MEGKRIVIYSHAFPGVEDAIKDTKDLGEYMKQWAIEQGLLPVALVTEVSNQKNGIHRSGLKACYELVRSGEVEYVLVLCREAISTSSDDVVVFLTNIEDACGDVISLRNDLPNEDGPYRFEFTRPKSEMLSYSEIIYLV